jgi:hypothetical protein
MIFRTLEISGVPGAVAVAGVGAARDVRLEFRGMEPFR